MAKLTTEEFIAKAKAVHGDKYDYSKVEYGNIYTRVCIICPKHGEFLQVARQHLKGIGCPACAGHNHWNYETCYEEAKKYSSRKGFQRGSVGAYTRALKRGWLKDYTWFFKPKTGSTKWNKERCYEEAQKYRTIEDFHNGSGYAYTKAKRQGWLDGYTWLYSSTRIWSKEACFEEAKKYRTKKEFQRGCSSAYNKASKNGWMADYTWFVSGYKLDGEKRRKWTYETCYEEAKKHKSRKEFKRSKGCATAYEVARKNGWLKDYTWFGSSPTPAGYWTYERCYEEARKYKLMADFHRNNFRAYSAANRNGWLKDYDWLARKRTKWTYQECYDLARKYTSRQEFNKEHHSAYHVAVKYGWINDFSWLKNEHRYRYWTKEQCYKEAQKYTSKKEFSQKNSSAYCIACKNGWIADYDWLLSKRYNLITDRIDCVYSYYFKETNSIYIGRTVNRKARDYQHIFEIERDAVARYAKELRCEVPPMIILEDNLTLKEGQEKEDYWKNFYTDMGFNILNKGVTGVGRGALGALGFGKWNRKACFKEAQKYTSRSAFCEGNGSAYSAASKRGWLKEYTWFEELKTPTGYWTYERCYEEAKKYQTKKQFYRGSERAYRVALKNGWTNDYTWFIAPTPQIKWTYEACLEKAKTCKSKVEFETKYSGAMNVARRNDWLKDYTWFERPAAKNLKWTYEACKAEASKYTSRGEFFNGSNTAYSKSLKMGWMDEFFPK